MRSEELNGRKLKIREAKLLLWSFFQGRKDVHGNLLTKEAVHTRQHIAILRSIEWMHAVEIFYLALDEFMANVGGVLNAHRSTIFLNIQQECWEAQVPKEYSGGMSILYLKLCLGYDVLPCD